MKLARQILIRIILLPLILAAGLAATGMLTIHLMFKPADVKAIVANQFQEILKRPVRLESAHLSYTGEIKIKGLQVTEPGPENVDFLKADYLYATYRLLPLLQRKLEIDSVVLVSPSISLIRRPDGRWNVSDIFDAYREESSKSLLNKISSAELKEGRISITDLTKGHSHLLENFNVTLSGFKPDSDTSFYASVFFNTDAFKRQLDGRFYAEGKVNLAGFDWQKGELKDLRADITLLNKTARLTGSLKDFRTPQADLKAETPAFGNADLDNFLRSPVKYPVKFSVPASSWKIGTILNSSGTLSASLAMQPLNIRAEGTIDISSPTPAYSFTVSSPPLELARLKRYGAALPFLEKPSGKAQIKLNLTSRDGKPVFSRAFVNSSGASFKYRNLTASGLGLSSLITGRGTDSYIKASRGKLAMGKNTLSGLRGKVDFLKDGMRIAYSGRFNGKPAKGRSTIKGPFSTKRKVDFIGYSEELPFSKLKDLVLDWKELRGPRVGMPEVESDLAWLKILKNSIPIGYSDIKVLYRAGRFSHEYMDAADFYASAHLRNVKGEISKITGDISIRSGAGTFYDVQKTSEKDHVYYIFSLPLTFIHRMNRVGALKFGYKVKDISFNSIGGDYTVDEGKVEIKNFYMAGKEFSAFVSGQLDFYKETMKVKIYTISGKYYSMGSLPEALTDASGKPALAFTLEGRMTDPDFKMISPKQSSRIIKEAAEKGVDIDFRKIDTFAGGK